ncbi:UNVERIFIED_CONTAM: hypothetical protein FKN15_059758 [Acipenser sinensis]
MEPLPASFYGKIDQKNPVISAFDTEIKEFMGYMKKLSVSVSGDYESYARGCTNLFHIWNKYKPRLPAYYYDEHLLLVGDFLVQIKFRGLQGRGICCYQLVKESVGSLQHQSSVQTLLRILAFQRLIMQAVLPHERLCWLLYNGTIHIYTISRHLMAMGHSAKVLEYLLWASVCMETSVPLLTVRYLPWRSTLYSAVCQCYYDCQAGLHAEVFARRALSKINELSKLEEMSTSRQSAEVERAFREATVKVLEYLLWASVCMETSVPLLTVRYLPWRSTLYSAVCQCYYDCQAGLHAEVFARRALSKINELSKLEEMSTSRQSAEVERAFREATVKRLLMEMFDGSAAQFLALLEALWDSSRRLLQTGHSEENEVAEVALELFSAGINILDGGGGSPGVEEGSERRNSPVTGIKPEKTLLQLAVTGENGVSVEGAVKLVKLAFHYEQWDSFDHIVHPVIRVLQKLKDPVWKKEELDLKLLIAMEPLYSGHRQRYGQSDSSALGKPSQSERDKPSGPGCGVDDLMNVAETLFACVCTPLQGVRPDRDIVVDVVLLLCQKCKAVFQRVQTGASDSLRYLQRLDNHSKWVRVLWLLNEVIHSCDIADMDPAVMAEVALRLAMVLESSAESAGRTVRTSGENGVSVEGAVKLVKLAFHYEQWDSFDHIVHPVIRVLQKLKDPVWKKEELDLKLLIAMEPLYSGHRQRYGQSDSSALGKPSQSERDKPSGPGCGVDDLMNVAETLFACVCTPLQGVRPDRDIVVDVVLLLCQKCKAVFQRVQTGASDSLRYLQRLDNHSKWVRVLWLLNEVIHSCDIADMDPAVMAEVALRLAMVLESSAESAGRTVRTSVLKFKRRGRFLEFVVQVMQRAVQEDQVELALTWGQEVYSWLNRRDAALRVSKKGAGAEPPGGRVGEEVKSRDWKAMEPLVALLSPMVLGFLQRRRLRQVCADECPWRCQLNAVIALGNFAIFGKCLEQCRLLGSESYSQLDPALFSLDNAGTVVERRSSAQRSRHPEQLKTAPKPPSKLPARKGTISGAESIESDSDGEVDTPRTQLTNDIGSTYRSSSSKSVRMNVSAVEQLDKAMLHFRRAVVLAHRGGHWGCLQGVCRSLWDRARLALALLDRAGGSLDQPSLTHDQLSSTLTPVLFLAADCLLDMLIHLQDSHSALQLLQAPGVFSISSCVGDASWEEGGSGLQWDSSLDDVTVVDLKWVRALVLYTLELLHQQKRWESLAYLAIHFNAITHERYTLQVTPLLVYAQRKLLKRIDQFGGPEAPQPHLLRAAGDSGEGVTSRNFVGKQLLIGTLSKEEIRPGSHIDPKEHNAYSDGRRAKALVSVPLDVTDTLSCFRESLEKMHYTSRALQHSRKLLALFLAHTQQDTDVQNTKDSGRLCSGKVEFSVGAEQPPPPCPPDLFTEEFSSLSATQSKPLPRSQLSAVIASYCKTIELLQASKQDSLRAQALHELGNLHFYNGNKRAAYTCWSQALDSALTQPGVLTSWKESADSSDHSESFLRRAGIWGCLQGAVLTAKIAQYILTSDISQQTECCMLSALLFKALLRASLPHPWLDRDWSSYGLGEGWDVLELIPGVDLFTDRHRAEIHSTVGSLAFLTQRLHSTGHSLTVLPLLTLYEYFVSKICQDSQRTIECRILKVAVLTELRLYGDAVRELLSLLHGERMPKLTGGTCLPEKRTTLDELVTKQLSSELSVLFSPRLVRSLNLVKAQLLSSLCTTINEFPETQAWEPKGAVEAPANLKQRESPCLLIEAQNNRLTAARLKGFLLREAACTLFSLLDGLNTDQDSVLSQLPAASLESAVEAKLLLSAISLQQGRAAASAALALSAMRLLQDSPVFVRKSPPAPRPVFSALRLPGLKKNWQCEDDSGPVPSDLPSNAEARERMGVSQWLRCRLAVLRALSAHIPVVAIHQGRDHTADSASLLSEGIAEAEAIKDSETQAELLLQAAVLDTQEGRPQGAIIPMLQLVTLGESLELGEGGAVLINQSTALKNIYLPHIPLLAKVTLRLGHAAAQKAACSSSREGSLQWRAAHQVLSSALELCRASGTREGDLEAEILFHKGTVERHLVYLSDFKPLAAIESFMETIAVSRAHDDNLILLRRSYLEIALLYQHLSTKHSLKPPEKEKTKEKPPARGAGKQKVMSKRKQKTDTMKPPEVVELNQLLSWVAVRAAAQVSEASVQRALLTGGSCDETKPLARSTLRHLPDFTLNDLLASYADFQPGEYKEIFRDLLGPSQDEREACPGDCKSSESAEGLTWSHIVRYLHHLLQLYSVSTLPVDSPCEDRMCSSVLDTGLALRLAHLHSFLCTHLSTYQAQCSSAEPPSELLQKSPAQVLLLYAYNTKPVTATSPPKARLTDLSCGHKLIPLLGLQSLHEKLCSVRAEAELSMHHTARAEKKNRPRTLEKERPHNSQLQDQVKLCCEHVKSLLLSPSEPQEQELTEVLLLYAYNTKPVTATSPPKARLTDLSCGHKLIPLLGLQSLHEKLCSVRAEAELSMHHTARAEKKNRPRTLEKERPHNSQLQDQVKLCCEHVKSLLLSPSEPQEQELTELPFEWSLQSLCDLERIFDPAHSCLLTGGSVFDWITALLT